MQNFACRSKAKAKPQRRELAGSSKNRFHWKKELDCHWTMEIFFLRIWNFYVTFLLLHSQQIHREEDGVVHFWRMKENLQNQFPQSIHWSDDRCKVCLVCSRRRSKKTISVLHWWFRNNHFSELLKDIQDAILLNLFAGQCCDSERILPI